MTVSHSELHGGSLKRHRHVLFSSAYECYLIWKKNPLRCNSCLWYLETICIVQMYNKTNDKHPYEDRLKVRKNVKGKTRTQENVM